MEILKKSVELATWEELAAAAKVDSLERYLSSGDIIPFSFIDGEKNELIVSQDERGRWYFVLKHAMREAIPYDKGDAHEMWSKCQIRKKLNSAILKRLPEDMRNVIVPTENTFADENGNVIDTSKDKLFLLSRTQVFGPQYSTRMREPNDSKLEIFNSFFDRCRDAADHPDVAIGWFLRNEILEKDSDAPNDICAVSGHGNIHQMPFNLMGGVVFAFCIG